MTRHRPLQMLGCRGLRNLLLVLVLVLAALLAPLGCMGPTFIVQQYTGPVRPPETIAVLRVNGKDAARLVTLDGQDMDAPLIEDGRLHIELLPGRHAIAARNANTPDLPPTPMMFTAEAGKVYRVVFTPEAHVFEVDRSTDTVGRDATAPERNDEGRQQSARPKESEETP